jgi:hypothetical protein
MRLLAWKCCWKHDDDSAIMATLGPLVPSSPYFISWMALDGAPQHQMPARSSIPWDLRSTAQHSQLRLRFTLVFMLMVWF